MHEILEPDALAREAPAAPNVQSLALTFTGSGKEYFRIWVVNLMLTVATLGIYSAWAKVRRLQYFGRNTQLAGASFDFSGMPPAILKGRLLALVLLVAYHYAFGFSAAVAVVIIGVLILALPFLLQAALRFRLSNTRYRGLPLGFCGSVGGAYLAYLPPVATFLLPGLVLTLYPEKYLVAGVLLLYLAWPAMHGMIKRYQHRHLQYGNLVSRYDVPAYRFYVPYLISGLLMLLGAALAGMLAAGGAVFSALIYDLGDAERVGAMIGALFVGLSLYIIFLLTGPYLQVRFANLAWSNTSFQGVQFKSTMKVREMMGLQLVNTLLTLLTLGLYRPFAVVRIYKYRMAHLTLEVQGDVEDILAGAETRRAGAAGDGTADVLGVDLSW